MNRYVERHAHLWTRQRVLRAAGVSGALIGAGSWMAACGGSDDTTTGATTAPGASRTQAAAPAATRASLPGEMVIANEAEPSDLGPYPGGFGTWLVTAQIYETLVAPRLTINQAGVVERALTYRLATSAERVEPTRWRFKLRQGVSFHNGEPWNATAAKFSFDTMANAKLATDLKKSSILARNYQGVEVIDEGTIDFLTKTPDAEALSWVYLGFVGLPPKLTQEKGIEHLFENPVGTGPYKFKSWTRGQDIRLEKHTGHWNTTGANMSAVRYLARREAAVRAQMVKAGEAHFAYNIGAEQAQGLRHSVTGGGFQSSGIRVNNTIAPTNDIRVRRALNLAIDRQGIVKTIFRGTATPIAFFGFQPVKLEPFPYRPDEAKKLIDAAGVRGAQLDFIYGEGRIPEEDQLAEIYKAAFEAIGLKITLKKLEPKQYNELGSKPFPEQPSLYMETTSSGNYGEIAGGLQDKYGCNGTGTFCKPEFDAEYMALAALDGAERNAKLQSIAERLHNDETPRVWVAAVQQVHGLAEVVKPSLPANAYIVFNDLQFA